VDLPFPAVVSGPLKRQSLETFAMTTTTAHSAAVADSHDSAGHGHGDPLKSYLIVFAALMVLLGMTIGAYYIPFEKVKNPFGEGNLGVVNTIVALIIATIKASLVVMVFMHLRYGSRLTKMVAAAGFFFLGIMILFFFIDYLSRGAVRESSFEAPTKSNESMVLQEQTHQLNEVPGW
jgi:cytochrome c oxidase subunit 4